MSSLTGNQRHAMQIKIVCVCFPDEWAKAKKKKKRMLIPNAYCYSLLGCGEIGTLISCWWESKLGQRFLRAVEIPS